MPEAYRQAFAALGTTLEGEGVQLARVQPQAYRLFYGADGSRLDMLNDPGAMAAQLESEEAGAGSAFLRFRGAARGCVVAGLGGGVRGVAPSAAAPPPRPSPPCPPLAAC